MKAKVNTNTERDMSNAKTEVKLTSSAPYREPDAARTEEWRKEEEERRRPAWVRDLLETLLAQQAQIEQSVETVCAADEDIQAMIDELTGATKRLPWRRIFR